MKQMLMIPALLGSLSLVAQVKEGTVVYERVTNMHRTIASEQMKAFMPEFRTTKHQLQFSDSIAVFKTLAEEEAPDPFAGGNGGVVVRMSGPGAGGDSYRNYGRAVSLQSSELAGKTYLVTDSIKTGGWKITQEQKTILGYTCYKATKKSMATVARMRMMTMGPDGQQKDSTAAPSPGREIEVVAWYCPDLAAPAGPDAHGFLPGVILEVNTDNGLNIIKAVEVKTTVNKKDFKEPTKGKPISRQDFSKLAMEMLSQNGPNMMMRRGDQ